MSMMRSKNKHLPQRTCIACRQTKEKRSLIRLVRDDDGGARVDTSGKKPGRGAYICPDRACFELVLKKNRLEYALRTKLSADDRQALLQFAHGLPEES